MAGHVQVQHGPCAGKDGRHTTRDEPHSASSVRAGVPAYNSFGRVVLCRSKGFRGQEEPYAWRQKIMWEATHGRRRDYQEARRQNLMCNSNGGSVISQYWEISGLTARSINERESVKSVMRVLEILHLLYNSIDHLHPPGRHLQPSGRRSSSIPPTRSLLCSDWIGNESFFFVRCKIKWFNVSIPTSFSLVKNR